VICCGRLWKSAADAVNGVDSILKQTGFRRETSGEHRYTEYNVLGSWLECLDDETIIVRAFFVHHVRTLTYFDFEQLKPRVYWYVCYNIVQVT
jgi:hypothetical protein